MPDEARKPGEQRRYGRDGLVALGFSVVLAEDVVNKLPSLLAEKIGDEAAKLGK